MIKLLLSSPKYKFSSPSISSHKYWLSLSTSSSLSYNHPLSSSPSSNNHHRLSSSSLTSSSPSTSPDKYEHFFPSFYDEYITHRINLYYSVQTPHRPRSKEADKALKYVFDKHRMNFPDLEKEVNYEHEFDKINTFYILERHHFDVILFLSTHGAELIRIGDNVVIKAESLRGKHVLICCASLPLKWIDEHATIWRKLSLFYSEMSQSHVGCDFEMVIVANMKREWVDDEGVFDHFFTAFPGCLVVPMTHKYRRDYICKALRFDGIPSFFLVDPSEKVVSVSYTHGGGNIIEYGARGFPFTDEHIRSLGREDEWDSLRNTTLAGLLSCESNPFFVLHKRNTEETTCIGRLNEKLVGLYLFKQGDMLNEIHKIYQQCRQQGLDFEIILVCLSYDYSIHPQDFQDLVVNALGNFKVPNWWILPYNNSVYLRLCNLSGKCKKSDSMIIVGPHNDFLERKGGEIIYRYNIHFGTQVYPFTQKALLLTLLQRLEEITLESFLSYDRVYQDYECDENKMIPVTELNGKNVLVYMDIPLCLGSPWTRYHQVVQLYDKIKKIESDFELVFVPVLFPVSESEYPMVSTKARECIYESKMKWLVRPFDDPKKSEILLKHDAFVAMEGSYIPSSLLAFGKDGHIYSMDVVKHLWRHGHDPYPFRPESKNEILSDELRKNFHLF